MIRSIHYRVILDWAYQKRPPSKKAKLNKRIFDIVTRTARRIVS